MKGRHGPDGPRAGIEVAPLPAKLQDALGIVHQLGSGRSAKTDEEVGVGKLDLARDEGPAGGGLLRRRRAVSGRPPGHDVGDIDRCPVEADGGKHPVEQLP